MALDFTALKAKLTEVTKKGGGGNDALFKPAEGETRIRVVPLKGSPENPFQELYFHYLGNKTYISPLSDGERDPIAEFSDALVGEGGLSKEEYKQAKKFSPVKRTYLPIVVRGKETEGVKFWAFGKTTFEQILKIMLDEDYGDITDITKGNDLKITFTPKEKSDTDFAKTEFVIVPKQSPLHTDKDVVKKLLNEQPDLKSTFTKYTFEQLEGVLETYLKGGAAANAPSGPKPTAAPAASKDEWASETPAPAKTETPAAPSVDVEKEFSELFNS